MKEIKNKKKFKIAGARWKKMVKDSTEPLLVDDIGVPKWDIKKEGITQW